MATHSITLAWKIPWMDEPGRLQSMGSQRVRHDRATSLHFTLLQGHLNRNQDNGIGGHGTHLPPINASKIQLHVKQSSLETKWRQSE